MRLDDIEFHALNYLFGAPLEGDKNSTLCVEDFDVLLRESSRAGFFSIIQFHERCRAVVQSQGFEKYFKYSALNDTVTFVCWVERDLKLCLEGFSENRDWPRFLMPHALK